MNIQNVVIGALCAWRENRGGRPQPDAMQSILNVLVNRAKQRGTDMYTEATRHLQFSSISAPGDPQLWLWPTENDQQWQQAIQLAQEADDGLLADLTNKSTVYYAPGGILADAVVPYTLPDGTQTVFPKAWNQSAVIYQREIAKQLFFREV